MRTFFTTGELAAALGEKVRTVQFWADAGALHPIPTSDRLGKGKTRRFPESEVKLARIAQRLAPTNSPIGEILAVLQTIRAAYSSEAITEFAKWSDQLAKTIADLSAVVDRHGLKAPQAEKLLNSLLNAMIPGLNVLGLCGGYTGEVYLIISYFGNSRELGHRLVFWPAEHVPHIDFIARAGISSFVGFKAMIFDAEQDLQLVSLPPKMSELFSDFDPLEILQFYANVSGAEPLSRENAGSSVCPA